MNLIFILVICLGILGRVDALPMFRTPPPSPARPLFRTTSLLLKTLLASRSKETGSENTEDPSDVEAAALESCIRPVVKSTIKKIPSINDQMLQTIFGYAATALDKLAVKPNFVEKAKEQGWTDCNLVEASLLLGTIIFLPDKARFLEDARFFSCIIAMLEELRALADKQLIVDESTRVWKEISSGYQQTILAELRDLSATQ